MKKIILAGAAAITLLAIAPAQAITVEQIIKLRRAGVSERTIRIIMDREGLSLSPDQVKRLKDAGVDNKTIRLIMILRQRRWEIRRSEGVRRVITNPDGSQEVVISSGGNPQAARAEARAEARKRARAWQMLNKLILERRLRR